MRAHSVIFSAYNESKNDLSFSIHTPTNSLENWNFPKIRAFWRKIQVSRKRMHDKQTCELLYRMPEKFSLMYLIWYELIHDPIIDLHENLISLYFIWEAGKIL